MYGSDEEEDCLEVENFRRPGRSDASIVLFRTTTMLNGLTSDNDRISQRLAELEELLGSRKKESDVATYMPPTEAVDAGDFEESEDAYQDIPLCNILDNCHGTTRSKDSPASKNRESIPVLPLGQLLSATDGSPTQSQPNNSQRFMDLGSNPFSVNRAFLSPRMINLSPGGPTVNSVRDALVSFSSRSPASGSGAMSSRRSVKRLSSYVSPAAPGLTWGSTGPESLVSSDNLPVLAATNSYGYNNCNSPAASLGSVTPLGTPGSLAPCSSLVAPGSVSNRPTQQTRFVSESGAAAGSPLVPSSLYSHMTSGASVPATPRARQLYLSSMRTSSQVVSSPMLGPCAATAPAALNSTASPAQGASLTGAPLRTSSSVGQCTAFGGLTSPVSLAVSGSVPGQADVIAGASSCLSASSPTGASPGLFQGAGNPNGRPCSRSSTANGVANGAVSTNSTSTSSNNNHNNSNNKNGGNSSNFIITSKGRRYSHAGTIVGEIEALSNPLQSAHPPLLSRESFRASERSLAGQEQNPAFLLPPARSSVSAIGVRRTSTLGDRTVSSNVASNGTVLTTAGSAPAGATANEGLWPSSGSASPSSSFFSSLFSSGSRLQSKKSPMRNSSRKEPGRFSSALKKFMSVAQSVDRFPTSEPQGYTRGDGFLSTPRPSRAADTSPDGAAEEGGGSGLLLGGGGPGGRFQIRHRATTLGMSASASTRDFGLRVGGA